MDENPFLDFLLMGLGVLAVVVVLCCLAALAWFCLQVKAVLHNPGAGDTHNHDGGDPEQD